MNFLVLTFHQHIVHIDFHIPPNLWTKHVVDQPLMHCPCILQPKKRTPDEQAITFTDEDASRVHHPHDDAIVISLLIADYSTRRVYILPPSLD